MSQTQTSPNPSQCPVHATGHRKAFPATTPRDKQQPVAAVTVCQDNPAYKTWTLRSYETVRQILRNGQSTHQAGFSAEAVRKTSLKQPVLFQDGELHKKQRTAIAKFFTPRAVQDNYQEFMETFSQDMIAELREKR